MGTEEQGGDAGDDRLVSEQEELAAEEAGEIGGRRDPDVDPTEQAVLEQGGGVAEGFEAAEEELRAHAEHRDPGGNPKYDASSVDEERTDAVYGEADHVESTQMEEPTGPDPDG